MKILVSGAAGFLGAHLCGRLLRNEMNEVWAFDDLSTGRLANIVEFQGHSRFHFSVHDVREPYPVPVSGFTRIYNLACPASPPWYQKDPVKTMTTSVMGAIQMLEIARLTGARILQASTSEVYGDPGVTPQDESYWGNVNPFGPRACYDEGKRAAETLMYDYHTQYGVEIRVPRIFNTYGPLMSEHDGRVISNFIVQALRGEPLTIYGTGNQSRSFCYVDDLIEGLMALMEVNPADVSPHVAPLLAQPVNLGNPTERNMNEIACLINRMCGRPESNIRYVGLPKDDPRRRVPNIARMQALTYWTPRVNLLDGLNATITAFRGRRRTHDHSDG